MRLLRFGAMQLKGLTASRCKNQPRNKHSRRRNQVEKQFGRVFSQILGLLRALDIPYIMVILRNYDEFEF